MRTTNKLLGVTRDGCKVYDREDSHIYEGGITQNLLKEAFSYMYMNREIFKIKEIQFRRIIGIDKLVSVTEKDEVVIAYLKGRNGPMPLVKNRQGEPSSHMTVIIRKERGMENHYTLVTAYIGKRAIRGPWDKGLNPGSEEMQQSIEFWKKHALIFEEELVERLA